MGNYDVFLSHNSKDKSSVEQIARRLRDEYKFKVWFDKWNLTPGEPWQEEFEKGIDESETIAVFLGKAGFRKWENEGMRAAIEARVSDSSRRVMPILLPGASERALSVFVRRLTWIDFRSGLNDETAFYILVCDIQGVPPGDAIFENRLPEPEILPEPGALPYGWRISNCRNAVFTGREDDLKALAKALLYDPQKTGTAVPQVITGMIGIGKTQLAVEFCYRYGRYFQGVHWINAQQAIGAEIAACGAEMELPFWPQTTVEQQRITLHAWQKDGPRLLVLDCVEDPNLIHKWLPRLNGFRLLLITRQHDWPPDLVLQTHPLDLLSPPESLTLLRKLAPGLNEIPDAELEDIAKQLDNLPLALDLAGRYLKELNEAGGGLKHISSLVDWMKGINPTDHETNLAATFFLIWQQLNEKEPIDAVARKIFLACGYCAPNIPIPNDIIYHILEESERITDCALKRLNDLGLLTINKVIHYLLAEFARQQDREKKSLVVLTHVLTRLSYEANTTGLPDAFTPLRPHVEAAAHAAESVNLRTVADDLWGNLGTHYRIVAEFEKAEYADRQALTIDEEAFGPVNTRTALRLNNLGRVLHVEGKLGDAKQQCERALAIDEEVLGPNHPTVALRLNNLGMILKDLGDLKGAKEKIERALVIDEQAFSPNHPNIVRDINNLGWVLKDMYELQRALRVFERACEIDEAAYGPNHPNVARDINNIGWVLKDTGKFKEALGAFKRSYAIDEATLTSSHPNVASDLNNIGWALRELGNYKEALESFKRARAIDEEAYGPNHPTVARDINNIGRALEDLGELREAQEAYEDACRLYKKVYHPNHPEVANVVNNIGTLLKSEGRLEEAKQLYEHALDIDEKVFRPDHLSVARDIHNLGTVLKGLGKLERGKQLIKRALTIYEKSLPADHPLILTVRENLEIPSNQTNPDSAPPL